jgi:hypothetical protein
MRLSKRGEEVVRGEKRTEEYLVVSGSNEHVVSKGMPVNVHEAFAVTGESSSRGGDVRCESSSRNGVYSLIIANVRNYVRKTVGASRN